jgi:hypothetical protein
VFVALSQFPNHAVVDDVRPGDLDTATPGPGSSPPWTATTPGYGTPFVPFAVACVVGELKRHLRDTSWRLHVPRPLKERALQLCKAADGLHQRLGRAPTTSELAEQLEMAEEEVLEGLAAASSRLEVSLDQPVDGDGDGCLGDLMPTPGAREEPEDLLALPDRGQGRMLPDAHLTVAASRPGPHARPAGRALNQRVVPPGRRPGVTCPAKPHRPSQPTRLPGVVGGPLPCLHVILGPIQRRGASGQPGLGRL